MLHYLFENFHERTQLLAQLQGGAAFLDKMTKAFCAPNASYRIDANVQCSSYFGPFDDQLILQFYPKGQLKWLEILDTEKIEQSADAKACFEQQFFNAQAQFLRTELHHHAERIGGQKINPLNKDRLDATWQHFLDGTYGVCTKDGLPETIFLKQTLVHTVDLFLDKQLIECKAAMIESLAQVVKALDQVEALFAPHERQRSSRQRCIVNVQEKYLRPQA